MSTETVYDKKPKTYNGKPLQLVSYSEKIANDNAWGKATADYYIDKAVFGTLQASDKTDLKDKQSLYEAYNNIIPQSLFDYVSDPLKGSKEKYKRFPAKIRPYNIIRPNIDLLIGEWNKRPFLYDVTNVDGNDVFNSFEAHKEKTFKDNTTQRFINTVNELAEAQGQEGTGLPTEEITDPRTVMSELNVSYKDAKALKGYRALKVLELELKLNEEWRKLFKDWAIAGESYTTKIPLHGDIDYNRLSPLWVDYDKGCNSPYIEDGDYAVVKYRLSPAEIVDLFYDQLERQQLKDIETQVGMSFPVKAYNLLSRSSNTALSLDKLDVYYVCWKTRKKIGFLKYPDPVTFEEQYDIVDEAYKADTSIGEEVEWMYVNEVYQDWRIDLGSESIHLDTGAVEAQRNEMNNFSACKLPVNGKRFSDTETENISLVWLGMPYQILYIVLMYRIELNIAKSKGKVALLDKNTIPDEDEGGEEAFFWYSEAMGYALIDRSGEDVDKSWNQYSVLDMDLFQYIKELITIADYVKAQWDELLGITRQRKGQTASSDGLGVTEQAIFRSSVISDLIFTGFEEFLETELQGLLDLSKYAWVDGKKGYYRNDNGRLEMLALEPDDYTSTQYGVHIQNISQHVDKLNMMKQQINAVAQRKEVKVSTILDMTLTDSITELKALVKKAEAAEADLLAKQAQSEAERAQELEQMKKEYDAYLKDLDLAFMHQQEDRLDNREYIKASLDKDAGAGVDPYLSTVEEQATERLKRFEESRIKEREISVKEKAIASQERMKDKEIKSKEKIAREANITALKNKASGEK